MADRDVLWRMLEENCQWDVHRAIKADHTKLETNPHILYVVPHHYCFLYFHSNPLNFSSRFQPVLYIHNSMAYTECPTRYRTRHFFNNSNTNEDNATKFEQENVRCVRNEEECVCSVCLQCVSAVCVCSVCL